MKMKIKDTDKLLDIIPKPWEGKLRYMDVATGETYDWDDLEPVRVSGADASAEAVLENESTTPIKIGVTPVVKATITTKKV